MGHAARRNETAQSAKRGELLSRASLLGAMDHALEMHAAALRLLEAKIVALKERITYLESFHPNPGEPQLPQLIIAAASEYASAQPCGCDLGAGWTCETHRSADV